jgi:hypothetical protein
MKLHCPLTTKHLRELTGNSKMTDILQKNYYLWFQRVHRGSYALTPQGEADLLTFSHVTYESKAAIKAL